ncbi:hypothetical protein NHQ30_007478 [Ciborinia camelliae]|nr:hypothetical protein NHQ30_007478 [Ciborinia camelliae]
MPAHTHKENNKTVVADVADVTDVARTFDFPSLSGRPDTVPVTSDLSPSEVYPPANMKLNEVKYWKEAVIVAVLLETRLRLELDTSDT